MTTNDTNHTPNADRGPGSEHHELAAPDGAWADFRAELTAYLQGMVDADNGDHLVLELSTETLHTNVAKGLPYAQIASFGDGTMLRAEVSGDAYLAKQWRPQPADIAWWRALGWRGNDDIEPNWHTESPVEDAARLAAEVVHWLGNQFGIVHPELLSYRAWGPAAEHAALLGLTARPATPPEVMAPEHRVLVPTCADELHSMVAEVLAASMERAPEVDTDGDFVLHHLGQPVWVRVHRDQPAVEIMARVAHEVHSRRATAAELSILNRDYIWPTWYLLDRDIWQRVMVPAFPFVPSQLEMLLGAYVEAMSRTRDDLAFRVGGRVG